MNKEYLDRIDNIRSKIRSGLYVNLYGCEVDNSPVNGEQYYE